MDGDEQVCAEIICHAGPVIECDKLVIRTCLYDFHSFAFFPDEFTHPSGNFQVDVFFERAASGCSLVVSSMSGIDDQHERFLLEGT